MRKHSIIFLALILMMSLSRTVLASDIEWKIQWQDNGTLHEEIKISGQEVLLEDSNWQPSQEGEQYVLSRNIENWSSYHQLHDRLPLQVQQKNYLIFKKAEISIDNQQSEGLFKQFNELNSFHLSIRVPGIIMRSSADQANESIAKWDFSNSTELLQRTSLIKVIIIDGLLLGIEIFLLGLLIIIIKFIRHLKKVDQIIEEEYSLTKVNDSEPKNDGNI